MDIPGGKKAEPAKNAAQGGGRLWIETSALRGISSSEGLRQKAIMAIARSVALDRSNRCK